MRRGDIQGGTLRATARDAMAAVQASSSASRVESQDNQALATPKRKPVGRDIFKDNCQRRDGMRQLHRFNNHTCTMVLDLGPP
jgi:cytochrome c5